MPKILIVDDDEAILDYLEGVLSAAYDVTTAKGAIEGLARFLELQHELVIVDLVMPFLNGHGLIDKIMGTGYHPQFLIITGASDQEPQNTSYQDIQILNKPFSQGLLIEKIKGLLGR